VTWARYEYLRKELEIAKSHGMPDGTNFRELKKTVRTVKEELMGTQSVLEGFIPTDPWVAYMEDDEL
jgi:hypothetical protein